MAPVLPVFGQITPFPATPLYDRLAREGRLTRPRHWLEFAPFHLAHTPLKLSVEGVQTEVKYAWTNSYSPAATRRALDSIGKWHGANGEARHSDFHAGPTYAHRSPAKAIEPAS